MVEKNRERRDISKRVGSLDIYHAAVFLTFALSLYSVSPSLQEGHLTSWDYPAHLTQARLFDDNLNLESLGIWAWYPGWYLGAPLLLFYSPGFFMAVSAIHSFLGWYFSLEMCMKILVALSYAFLPPAIYSMARNFGYSKRIALYAAIFAMAAHSNMVLGVGFYGIYWTGLYNHAFSIPLFAVFLGVFHKTMCDKQDRLFLPAGLLLGYIYISHMITAFYALFALAIYLLIRLAYGMNIDTKKIFLIGAVSFFSSAFWLYPFFSSQYLLDAENSGFQTFSFWEIIVVLLTRNFLATQLIGGLLLIGSFAILFKHFLGKKNPVASMYLLILLLFTIVVSSDAVVEWLENFPLRSSSPWLLVKGFRSLLLTRATTYLSIIVPVLAAIGLDSIYRITERLLRGVRTPWTLVSTTLILSMLILSFSVQQRIAASTIKTIERDYSGPYLMWGETFDWIDQNVPDNSVFKSSRRVTWAPYPGFTMIDPLLNLETGVRTLGGGQLEACQRRLCDEITALDRIDSLPDDAVKEGLFRFDVDYVLSCSPARLNKTYLEEVYSNKDLTIYQVTDLGEQDYEVLEKSSDYRGINMRIKSNETHTNQIPVQYNDHFSAIVNGEEQQVMRGKEGLVEIRLNEGDNYVRLAFRKTPIESFFVLMSLGTVALVMWAWVKGRDDSAH